MSAQNTPGWHNHSGIYTPPRGGQGVEGFRAKERRPPPACACPCDCGNRTGIVICPSCRERCKEAFAHA